MWRGSPAPEAGAPTSSPPLLSPPPPGPEGALGARPPPPSPSRLHVVAEALAVTAVTTGAVTAAARFVPERFVATVVGFLFLSATWLFAWRRDDAFVEASGLSLGGLVLPGRLPARRIATSLARAVLWASLLAVVVFVPFYFGWRRYWHAQATGPFHFGFSPLGFANEAFGQLVIIALPEEAFYRGYLQSRLDSALGPRLRVFGAEVGAGVLVTSALFALGHLATVHSPARLAVFFPSLLFGWLRARTRGIGASCLFHAMCNVFSEVLGKGYGLY
ncbi:MAG TPA: MrtC family glutamic-type intramembrane protease [Polyangiaceae bacterium]|nr:MrtC family glutamic-type intramembrane protease [Polyangiaceae bacterium]